jgi:hypothetical protein
MIKLLIKFLKSMALFFANPHYLFRNPLCSSLSGIFFVVLLSLPLWAGGKKGGRHVHGEAQLHIAFDEKQGVIFFQTPTEAIVGFEHSGRNESQKKQYEQRLQELEKKGSSLMVLPEGCEIQKLTLKTMKEEGSHDHQDLVLEYSIHCANSVKGSVLGVKVQDFYPKIKKLEVEQNSPSGSKKINMRAPQDLIL